MTTDNKTQAMSLRIPSDLFKWIDDKAKADDRTYTYVIIKMLRKLMDDEKKLSK